MHRIHLFYPSSASSILRGSITLVLQNVEAGQVVGRKPEEVLEEEGPEEPRAARQRAGPHGRAGRRGAAEVQVPPGSLRAFVNIAEVIKGSTVAGSVLNTVFAYSHSAVCTLYKRTLTQRTTNLQLV